MLFKDSIALAHLSETASPLPLAAHLSMTMLAAQGESNVPFRTCMTIDMQCPTGCKSQLSEQVLQHGCVCIVAVSSPCNGNFQALTHG